MTARGPRRRSWVEDPEQLSLHGNATDKGKHHCNCDASLMQVAKEAVIKRSRVLTQQRESIRAARTRGVSRNKVRRYLGRRESALYRCES
jgi:hypothetical protein